MTVPWLLSDAHGHMGTKAERNERREAGIPSILCAITPKEAKELIRESREENLGGEDGRQQERYLFPAAGIHPWYEPDMLIGKKVVVVANLKPAKLRGVESNGMILAADAGENDVKVLFLDESIPCGSVIR